MPDSHLRPKIARRLRAAYRSARSRRSVRIGGRSYSLPKAGRRLLSLHAEHEPWLDWVYEEVFRRKKGTFVDVGMNQGQTLAKMLRLAPDNRYIGIEPQPGCVFAVDEFLTLNRLGNCSVVPVGLADHTGLSELSLHSLAPGDTTASIASGHRPQSFYVQSKVIPVFPGDDVLSMFPDDSISLIKIDVEGAELEVLKGLSSTLDRHRPFVLFEVLNNYLVVTRETLPAEMANRRNERARQISSYFDGAGYVVFNIRGRSLVRSKVITPEVSADLSITDYLAVPSEMAPAMDAFVRDSVP